MTISLPNVLVVQVPSQKTLPPLHLGVAMRLSSGQRSANNNSPDAISRKVFQRETGSWAVPPLALSLLFFLPGIQM